MPQIRCPRSFRGSIAWHYQVKSITQSSSETLRYVPSGAVGIFAIPSSSSSQSISIGTYFEEITALVAWWSSKSRTMGSWQVARAECVVVQPATKAPNRFARMAPNASLLASRSLRTNCSSNVLMLATIDKRGGSCCAHWEISFSIKERFWRKCLTTTGSNSE